MFYEHCSRIAIFIHTVTVTTKIMFFCKMHAVLFLTDLVPLRTTS